MIKKRRKSKIIKIARAISYIFDGSVLAIPIVFASIYFYKVDKALNYGFLKTGSIDFFKKNFNDFIITITFLAAIPYILILILFKFGKISDLQITRRKERVLPLIIINLFVLSGYLILNFKTSNNFLLVVYSIYLFCLPLISLITLFWKISFHSSYITLFSIVYIMVFGKWALFTLSLIPIVGWSRIRLKKHTPAQVFSGFLITAFISIFIFFINGYFNLDYWVVNELAEIFKSTYSFLLFILSKFNFVIFLYLIFLIFQIYNKNKSYSGFKEKI